MIRKESGITLSTDNSVSTLVSLFRLLVGVGHVALVYVVRGFLIVRVALVPH